MSIKQQLTEDMKQSMKNKDKSSLTTIRLIIDRIQKKEKDSLKEATEEEVVQVLQTFKKQVEEEKVAFIQRGNTDKVVELDESLHIIQRYLPAQLTKLQVSIIVHNLASQLDNKGAIMKVVMPELKGKADNKLIGEVVDQYLAIKAGKA